MVDVNELEQEAAEAARAAAEAEEPDDVDSKEDRVSEEDGDGLAHAPFDADLAGDTPGDYFSDDGDALPDDVRAELEALASEEFDDGTSTLEAALAEAQRELARQRTLTRHAVARYREALLAAEPELPPELIQGDTIEDLDTSAASARQAVERIRERVAAVEPPRGFPVGAPARSAERGHSRGGQAMSAHEKIATGLQERLM